MGRRRRALLTMTDIHDRAITRPYLLPQGVLLRAIAYIIDSFLVALAAFTFFTLIGWDAPVPPGLVDGMGFREYLAALRDYTSTDFGFVLEVSSQGLLVVYALVAEAVWGRTLGKLVLGLEVVRAADGARCGWRGAIIRNLLRPFDLIFAGMPGALLIMVSRRRQRLGDLAGGTLVVRRLPALPSFAGMPMPGVLRRCEGCGGLVEAAGGCARCAQPPAASDVPQPIAVMMAVGQAAAGFSAAAEALLAAESDFRRASSDEYERLDGGGAAGRDERTARSPEEPAEPPGPSGQPEPPDDADAPFTEAAEPSTEPAEPSAESAEMADEYSAPYVNAWVALLDTSRTLHRRYALFEEAARQAGLTPEQAAAMQPEVARWADDLGGYLAAEDDEAVFEAFRLRALTPPA